MTRPRVLVPVAAGLVLSAAGWLALRGRPTARTNPAPTYVGSAECRSCHERFYELWSTSHHGLAMQPFTPALAARALKPQEAPVEVEGLRYTALWDERGGHVREEGPDGVRRLPILHAMGGKNVFYFLTPLERGRLQVLPVAFNVRTGGWYHATASMVRHAAGRRDVPVRWTDPYLTFNTSCHSCHVSQLETNYDAQADAYRTTWVEPGINCETCHGPSSEHVRVAREAGEGRRPAEMRLLSYKTLTVEQINATCAACHAKASSISSGFRPGDRELDHLDLAALEDPDFYADGRDLGENYTYTSWRMSPCVKGGTLSCIHCHTSSGRYRFSDAAKANAACLPCHQARVAKVAAHSHHPADSPASRCVACHMPMTEFALMRRSDHSMRPPAPAASLAFGSPNACNLCHKEKDAAWADRQLRKWGATDHQAALIERARLVDAARRRDWTRLPAILRSLEAGDRDEIVTVSLVRLLDACADGSKWPVLLRLARDRSALVRAAVAVGLRDLGTPEGVRARLDALGDDVRLVRVRAASALPGVPREGLSAQDADRLARVTAELEAGLRHRLDDWSSHYNLGNLKMDRGDVAGAAQSYEAAVRLRPDAILPLVNGAMAYARLGQMAAAERTLRRALEAEPGNAVTSFNLGLLEAELGRAAEAERLLRQALQADPEMAQAAYNLGMLLPDSRAGEAVALLRKAVALQAGSPRYTYALAYRLDRSGASAEAVRVLSGLVDRDPGFADGYALLGEIHERRGQKARARETYARASSAPALSADERRAFETRLRALGR